MDKQNMVHAMIYTVSLWCQIGLRWDYMCSDGSKLKNLWIGQLDLQEDRSIWEEI